MTKVLSGLIKVGKYTPFVVFPEALAQLCLIGTTLVI